MEEFHPYVTLLIARMKSNPQEFVVGVRSDYEQYLTSEELDAVRMAEREIILERRYETLMARILKGNADTEPSASSIYRTTDTAQANLLDYGQSPHTLDQIALRRAQVQSYHTAAAQAPAFRVMPSEPPEPPRKYNMIKSFFGK